MRQPEIRFLERPLPDYPDSTVRSALIQGTRWSIVVDTLMAPADMTPFAGADLAVYTHGDWDHCWGTTAFPAIPVIGHRLTRERMQSSVEAELLASMQAEYPDAFAGSALIPPEITFEERLQLDAGGLTAALHYLPGHTHDSIVVAVPERELLLAGDTAEDPIPSLNVPGFVRAWAPALRRWASSGIRQVVPSHGRISGPDLLVRNAVYLEELVGEIEKGIRTGLTLAEIQRRLSVERFLPDVDQYSAYYRATHPSNVEVAYKELLGGIA